jgi:hypothetical protein
VPILLFYDATRHDVILKHTCGGVLKIIAMICEHLVRLLDYHHAATKETPHMIFMKQLKSHLPLCRTSKLNPPKPIMSKVRLILNRVMLVAFIALSLLALRMYFWEPEACGTRLTWDQGVQTQHRQIDGSAYPGTRLHGDRATNNEYPRYNATQVVDCSNETDLSVVRRYLYIEYRDADLSKDLATRDMGSSENKRLFEQAAFKFLKYDDNFQCNGSKNLGKENPFGACSGFYEYSGWDPKAVLKHAPKWLPQDELNKETFIGFFGEGTLFKGKKSNQYFGVSF